MPIPVLDGFNAMEHLEGFQSFSQDIIRKGDYLSLPWGYPYQPLKAVVCDLDMPRTLLFRDVRG